MFVDKNMEVLSTWRDSGKYLPSNTKRRQLMMRLLGCFGKRQCKPASLFERQRYAQLRIVTNSSGLTMYGHELLASRQLCEPR
jgi:hypothetical protein